MPSDKRLVIITGGTGGLGQALAALHLDMGDQVVITSRDEGKLKAVLAEKNCRDVHVYKLDVTDNAAVKAFCAWIHIRFGRCDILYNNAGTAVFKPFLDMSLDDISATLRTNLDGPIYMTRAFLPMMLSAGGGHIVNVASLAGKVATTKAAVYAASKAAVIRFSEGLRQELAGSKVYVTCVMPGPIDTPFLDRADAVGLYRQKVRRYLLSPAVTAKKIVRAVNARQPEVSMPFSLRLMSSLYMGLPQSIKRWMAPLINRK